jgi:predicted lactoylglutathione lyase
MSNQNLRQLFVNLPVRDLKRSMTFFSGLGFEFNPQFTDDKGACMIVGADAYVMLLVEPFFQTFTDRKICDTRTHTEALLAVSCASREGVDRMVETAVATGGAHAKDRFEHEGFMYGWSFYDVDGHHWEVLWMNPAAVE